MRKNLIFNERKKFAFVLFVVALCAIGYALFGMEDKAKGAIIFKSLGPEQEAVVMTSLLLVALGLFTLFRKRA